MSVIIDRASAPLHLSAIPELDLAEDLFVDPLRDPWFRLGAWTVDITRDARGIEDVIARKSFLLKPGRFEEIVSRLDAVGNLLGHLGAAGGSIRHRGAQSSYQYHPFHATELHVGSSEWQSVDIEDLLTGGAIVEPTGQAADYSTTAEPLVFTVETTSSVVLCINPDLWLFLKLEERPSASGVYWNPERAEEVLRARTVDSNLRVVEIRTDYLLRYLRARQMVLVIGHYRHLHHVGASDKIAASFVSGKETLSGSLAAKALIHSNAVEQDFHDRDGYLRRSLHLWFQVPPPPLQIESAFDEAPDFDLTQFTLPTASGPVAPARFCSRGLPDNAQFAGEKCDFMDSIYFRQDVLEKYQSAAGFAIDDDGSVRCASYWGLVRSTGRIGNELIRTAIGDFAEGVPSHEWPHWKQYAAQPPSPTMAEELWRETSIPEAVNALVRELQGLNNAFRRFEARFTPGPSGDLWNGSLDSLAGRQLKWVYPAAADDDEFLKRATLTSTLVLDELSTERLRNVLIAFGPTMHMKAGKALGSRNLLQRIVLVADLIARIRAHASEIPELVDFAERGTGAAEADIQRELNATQGRVRAAFAPLAFLYDLRTHGGVAHAPNRPAAATAASNLGFATAHWHRRDYLRLLDLVGHAVEAIATSLSAASES